MVTIRWHSIKVALITQRKPCVILMWATVTHWRDDHKHTHTHVLQGKTKMFFSQDYSAADEAASTRWTLWLWGMDRGPVRPLWAPMSHRWTAAMSGTICWRKTRAVLQLCIYRLKADICPRVVSLCPLVGNISSVHSVFQTLSAQTRPVQCQTLTFRHVFVASITSSSCFGRLSTPTIWTRLLLCSSFVPVCLKHDSAHLPRCSLSTI